MLSRIRRGMSFANVCAFLALVIALGTGTAYAANTVFSEDIVNGEVKTVDIHAGAVAAGKIAADAVNSSKVADRSLSASDLGVDSVGESQIADGSIDGGEIIDNSLGAADLAPNAVGVSELAANAVTGAKVANNSLTTADLAGTDITGKVSLSGIPNGRCNTVTFSVSGAQTGQVAVVATKAATQQGIVLYARRVASAGHVEVAACNFSGGAMTAISDLPVRVITFG